MKIIRMRVRDNSESNKLLELLFSSKTDMLKSLCSEYGTLKLEIVFNLPLDQEISRALSKCNKLEIKYGDVEESSMGRIEPNEEKAQKSSFEEKSKKATTSEALQIKKPKKIKSDSSKIEKMLENSDSLESDIKIILQEADFDRDKEKELFELVVKKADELVSSGKVSKFHWNQMEDEGIDIKIYNRKKFSKAISKFDINPQVLINILISRNQERNLREENRQDNDESEERNMMKFLQEKGLNEEEDSTKELVENICRKALLISDESEYEQIFTEASKDKEQQYREKLLFMKFINKRVPQNESKITIANFLSELRKSCK